MAMGTMNAGIYNGVKMDAARQEFLRQAHQQNVNLKAPGVYDASVKNFANTNEWASQQNHNRMSTELSIGESQAATATAEANLSQAEADATNIVGDVFTLGAHRNMGDAGDALMHGQLSKFAVESGKATMKVAATAALMAPALVGKAFQSSRVVQQAVTHSKALSELAETGATCLSGRRA